MYGHIHIILKDLVISELGCDAWVRLLKMSGFAEERTCWTRCPTTIR